MNTNFENNSDSNDNNAQSQQTSIESFSDTVVKPKKTVSLSEFAAALPLLLRR